MMLMSEAVHGAQSPQPQDEVLITSEEAMAVFEAVHRSNCGMTEDDALDETVYPFVLKAFEEEVGTDLDSLDPAVRTAAIDLARYVLFGIEDK